MSVSPPRQRLTIGQAFLPLLHNTDPFVLVESPRGCLKTCSILHILMHRACRWPGKRWYIWRSSRALLSTTVLPSFEEYVLPVWQNVRGMRLTNPNARPTQRSEYVFENGSVFLPIGLDDILRGTSSEGAGGYLAEAIELDNVDRALALAGMMRQPGVPFHQIICDVNPGPPGHWTNQTAEPIDNRLRHVTTRADYDRLQLHNAAPAADPTKRWKRLIARHADNPYYFDVTAWRFTEAGEAYLRTLDVLRGHLRRRWIDGEWVAAEGSVYPEFDEARHVIPAFDPPGDWPWYVGWDPGYDHPTAILWFTISPNGTLYVADEIYQGGRAVSEHAAAVKAKNRGRTVLRYYGDPQHAFSRTAQSPKTIAQQAGECGLRMMPWPRTAGNEESMVEAVRERLRAGTLKVFSRCTNAIREFQSWRYKRTADGQLPPGQDAFEDKDNHTCDVVKGVVATRPRYDRRGEATLA